MTEINSENNAVGELAHTTLHAHTMLRDDWVEAEYRANKYVDEYEKEPAYKQELIERLQKRWMKNVASQGEKERIATAVLDDFIKHHPDGLNGLFAVFRGVAEKGIQGYEWPEIRLWDKTYRQFLKHINDGVFRNANCGKAKQMHREIVENAIKKGEPVPDNVLSEYYGEKAAAWVAKISKICDITVA